MFILYILFITTLLTQHTWAHEKSSLLDKINQFDSGILVVKNKQTSCQLIVINEAYGFISANCITSSLEDMRAAIRGPSTTDLFKLNGVTNHPKYDPKTLANNIAVVHFDFNRDTKFDGKRVTASCQHLDQLAFVRRLLTKVDDKKAEWDKNPLVLEAKNNPSKQCSLGSPVFAANRENFICSDKAVSIDSIKKDCPLPYGLVYGEVKDNVGPAALYSHTVVFGEGLCSKYAKLHYYTYVENYLKWGESITGYKSKVLDTNGQKRDANVTAAFAMKCEEKQVPGVKVYGGDLFGQVDKQDGNPPPSSKTTSTCTTTSTIYLPKPTGGQQPTGSSTYIPNIVIVGSDGKTTPTDSGDNPDSNGTSPGDSNTDGTSPSDSNTDGTSPGDNTNDNSNSPTNISVVGSDGSTTPTDSSTDSTPTDDSSTDTPTHADAQNKKGGVSSNTSMIIGILVGLGVLILLIVGLWWYRRRKRLAEQDDLANR